MLRGPIMACHSLQSASTARGSVKLPVGHTTNFWTHLGPSRGTSETFATIRVTSQARVKHLKMEQVRDQCTIGAGAPAGLRRSSQTAHTRRAQSACRARTTRRTTKTNALYFLFAQTPSNLIHSQPSLSIGTRYLRDRPPSGRDGSANRRWQTVNDFKKERAMLDHEGQATGGQSETLPVEFKFRRSLGKDRHERWRGPIRSQLTSARHLGLPTQAMLSRGLMTMKRGSL